MILLVLLGACGAQPTSMMFGATRSEVMRDGRQYVVFQKENQVEIIRLGYARRGDREGIRAAMVALIPEVTGCRLIEGSLHGDSSEARGKLRC